MSLRKLTDAECGGPNALVHLTSHVTRDHAYAETHGHGFPASSDQLVEQFLAETRAAPQTFRMDDLMREMHEIESQRAAIPPIPASAVKDQIKDDAWALQYLEDSRQFNQYPDHKRIWTEVAAQDQAQFPQNWANEYFQEHLENAEAQQNANELVKAMGSDSKFEYSKQYPDHERIWTEVAAQDQARFEAQFPQNWADEYFQDHLENVEVQQNANELVEAMGSDPRFEYSKFMQYMKQVGNGEMNLQEQQDEAAGWSQEFLGQVAKEDSDGLAQTWAKEHTKSNDDSFNNSFWNNLQEEWRKHADIETDHSWATEFNNEYYDPYKEYTFSDENPMLDEVNPLERGKEMLAQGDLPSAVLCFEAAVKKDPENSEAWLLLGTSQAENEQDPKAIVALKKCLAIAPSNLQALMALAVSYTNESYYNQACQSLVTWLKENPKYRDLVAPDFSLSGQVTSLLNPNHHKIVQDLYIKAAQRNPRNVDYEVQCGLGVLFNLSGEYSKAADCFGAALSVKPEDARLWNRLGATLANGSMPEQAVDAYHRALALVPGFIRARYNVGITCINLSAYREAAEHFLIALNQQSRGKDITNSGATIQMSETIWSTLRMCLALMSRLDLKPLVDQRDLKSLSEILEVHD